MGIVRTVDAPFAAIGDPLRHGDPTAAATVFHKYTRRLLSLASRHIHPKIRSRFDAEDVVQSVYRTFFNRYASGQFQLNQWDEVWALLAQTTLRKCANRAKHHGAQRRNGFLDQEFGPGESAGDHPDRLCPTPLELAEVKDTIRALLEGMDATDAAIFALMIQGCTIPQISGAVGRSERTVSRRLDLFRRRARRLLDHQTTP